MTTVAVHAFGQLTRVARHHASAGPSTARLTCSRRGARPHSVLEQRQGASPRAIHGTSRQWQQSSSSAPRSSRDDDGQAGTRAARRPVSNAADISHAHFLASASADSDFNPTQTPSAGLDTAREWEGKLSPTTSHLFKLLLPLPDATFWRRSWSKGGGGAAGERPSHGDDRPPHVAPRPTAFLLHPSQPLSHLSRLIAGSLPPQARGAEITYLALTGDEEDVDRHLRNAEGPVEDGDASSSGGEGTATPASGHAGASAARPGMGAQTISASSAGPDDDDPAAGADDASGRQEGGPYLSERSAQRGRWQEVSWSQSTDLSDFIKQACLNESFKIVIRPDEEIAAAGVAGEDDATGSPAPVRSELVLKVTVPTFASRTVFLRRKLLAVTRELEHLTKMKKEIDYKAHRSAQRLAVAALGGGVVYWAAVIRFTFFTDAGWDMMEPVTWATGFGALLCSAAFLVYHNREVSYSSLLDLSISARKKALYEKAGLDVQRWSEMVSEAKQLRREISRIAADYDIEWRGELENLSEQEEARTPVVPDRGVAKSRDGAPTATPAASESGDVSDALVVRGKAGGDHAPGGRAAEAPEDRGTSGGQAHASSSSGRGHKIDIDKTIDEASELQERTDDQVQREKDAERKGQVVHDGNDDRAGDAARANSEDREREDAAVARGKQRARDAAKR